MMTEIYKGIGLGLSMLLGGVAIWLWRQKKIRDAKARAFDIEVVEKENHEKVDALDPDSLIDEANRWQGRKQRDS